MKLLFTVPVVLTWLWALTMGTLEAWPQGLDEVALLWLALLMLGAMLLGAVLLVLDLVARLAAALTGH